jgi:multidrug efflux pump subunit AcrB
MTMIVGIVTEVGVFYFAELTHEASPDTASLIRAGTLRMRPILMTSIIAVLALLPLALGLGEGAAMQTALAISIISGLCLAVPLVLLVTPAVYLLLSRPGRKGYLTVPTDRRRLAFSSAIWHRKPLREDL